eukprot:2384544-Amphidinium_carterae.1
MIGNSDGLSTKDRALEFASEELLSDTTFLDNTRTSYFILKVEMRSKSSSRAFCSNQGPPERPTKITYSN